MNEIQYNGKVESGKLTIANRKGFDSDLPLFEGKDVEIIVRKKRKIRSNQVNKFYWAEVVPKFQLGLQETGMRLKLLKTDEFIRNLFTDLSKDATHEFLKKMFIESIEVDTDTGEIVKKKQSTAKMTYSEFMDYTSEIIQFAAENFNIQINLPSEQDFNSQQ